MSTTMSKRAALLLFIGACSSAPAFAQSGNAPSGCASAPGTRQLFTGTIGDFRQSGLEITQDKRFNRWREKMDASIEEEAYATSNLDF